MRFMMFMLPGSYDEPTEADVRPMMAYNEELTKAGVLLALDGLQPPEKGARVTFAGGRPSVTDGPFAEAKEWASRCPAGPNDTIEVRQVFEVEDFDMDVPELSQTPPEQTSA